MGVKRGISSLAGRLSRNLQEHRRLRGLTQARLAELLGLEPESVSRFERGITVPSLATLEHMASILGTTVSGLLSDEDDDLLKTTQRIMVLLDQASPEQRLKLEKLLELAIQISRDKTL